MPGELGVDGLYQRDGERYVPAALTAGPWDRRAQHGGAPTALVGRLLVGHEPGEQSWFLGRLTVELIRPVPVAPLTVRTEVRRPGRRMQVLDSVVTDPDGTEVLWARGVRVAEQDNGLDEASVPGPAPASFPAPETCAVTALDLPIEWPSFGEAFELRQAHGAPFVELGPAAVWARLLVPVLAGEETHPLDRALTLADFPNGFANSVPFDRFQYINPDLTVSLHRLPRSEWVLLDAQMHPRAAGHGTAWGALHDERGPIGTCGQTLLISAR
jgi:hypothetical protein